MNNNKLIKNILLAVTAMVLISCPQIASAAPPVPNVSGDLEVNIVGTGTVTGTGISCPGDCLQSATWKETDVPDTNMLTATSTATGWAFQGWSGACEVQSNKAKCKSSYGTEEPFVSTAKFIDVMSPSIYVSSISPAADDVGDSIYAGVVTSDNDSVTKVEYLIDGQVMNTVTSSPWYAEIDTRGIGEGNHQLQARAFDPTGNNGITANTPITVDHTAADVSLNAPVTVTKAAAPEFSFDSGSGDFEWADCDIHAKAAVFEENSCDRNEGYSEDIPEEGTWVFEVHAFDRAGNLTVKTHEFVVDRTAPVLAFTSGPADGATIEKGNVSYGWGVQDESAVGQKCSVDNGAVSVCDRKFDAVLAKGTHTVTVDGLDQAGNASSISRTVTVKADGTVVDPKDPNDPDDPKDPNDPIDPDKPGTKDHTAPVVKLTTSSQKLKALKRGLKVTVSCDEACAGKVTATAKGGVKFSGTVNLTTAGTAKVKLTPNRKAKKVLRKSPKALKLSVVSTLSDAAGNQAVSTVRARVRS